MKRTAMISLLVLLAGLVSYIVTFSYLWLRSPSYHAGAWGHRVDFKCNNLTGRVLWSPGLWFMEHVCGYQATAVVVGDNETVVYYAKPEPE